MCVRISVWRLSALTATLGFLSVPHAAAGETLPPGNMGSCPGGIASALKAVFVRQAPGTGPKQLHAGQRIVRVSATDLGEDAISGLEAVITEVDEMVGDKLKLPQSLSLDLHSQGSNGSFRPKENRVTAVHQFVVETPNGTLSKHPKFTRPLLAHEYGHAVFKANLGDIQNYTEFLRGAEERQRFLYRLMEKELDPQIKELEGKIAAARLAGDAGSVHRFEMSLNDAKEATKAALDEVLMIHDQKLELTFYIRNYDELFADVVAVLHADSGSAVRDIFFFPESSVVRAPNWIA